MPALWAGLGRELPSFGSLGGQSWKELFGSKQPMSLKLRFFLLRSSLRFKLSRAMLEAGWKIQLAKIALWHRVAIAKIQASYHLESAKIKIGG